MKVSYALIRGGTWEILENVGGSVGYCHRKAACFDRRGYGRRRHNIQIRPERRVSGPATGLPDVGKRPSFYEAVGCKAGARAVRRPAHRHAHGSLRTVNESTILLVGQADEGLAALTLSIGSQVSEYANKASVPEHDRLWPLRLSVRSHTEAQGCPRRAACAHHILRQRHISWPERENLAGTQAEFLLQQQSCASSGRAQRSHVCRHQVRWATAKRHRVLWVVDDAPTGKAGSAPHQAALCPRKHQLKASHQRFHLRLGDVLFNLVLDHEVVVLLPGLRIELVPHQVVKVLDNTTFVPIMGFRQYLRGLVEVQPPWPRQVVARGHLLLEVDFVPKGAKLPVPHPTRSLIFAVPDSSEALSGCGLSPSHTYKACCPAGIRPCGVASPGARPM